MKYITPILLFIFLFSGLVQNSGAQTINLVELKKKEEERRKQTEKSKISINDSNVQKAGGGAKSSGFVQAQTSSTVEEATPEQSQPGSEQDKMLQEDYWRGLKTQLENRIKELEDTVNRDDSALNKLWTDFNISNDPIQQANIKGQISKLTNQLELNKSNLRQAKADLDALPERARKAGVPPGWVR